MRPRYQLQVIDVIELRLAMFEPVEADVILSWGRDLPPP